MPVGKVSCSLNQIVWITSPTFGQVSQQDWHFMDTHRPWTHGLSFFLHRNMLLHNLSIECIQMSGVTFYGEWNNHISYIETVYFSIFMNHRSSYFNLAKHRWSEVCQKKMPWKALCRLLLLASGPPGWWWCYIWSDMTHFLYKWTQWHSGRLTAGTCPHRGLVQIIFLSKWVICRFHVNLPGCKHKHIKHPSTVQCSGRIMSPTLPLARSWKQSKG